MSLKDHMNKLTSGLDDVQVPGPGEARHRRGSGSVPAPTSLMHFHRQVQEIEQEATELREKLGRARMIPLDLIDDSPYQIGGIEQERVDGLVANLKENKLNTPISVRVKDDGRFEILAGHHRRAAYRALGRNEIESTIRTEVSDEQASDLVFYDNLFAPSLTAYDRYEGFARIRARGVLQSDIATMSGLSDTAISQYFLFENLPAEARSLVRANPRSVKLEHVKELSPLAATHPARVIEAVRQIVARGISPKEARTLVEGRAEAAPPRPAPVKIKQGKRTYASISVREKRVIVEFGDAEEAKKLEKQIAELLKVRADAAGRE